MNLIQINKPKNSNGQIAVSFRETRLTFSTINDSGEALNLEKIFPPECTELYLNLENITDIDSCGLALLIRIKKYYPKGIKIKISDKRPKQLEKLNTLYLSPTGLI